MSEIAQAVIFYLICAVTLLAALGVVLGKNLVHSALLLTVSFFGVAGLYILLHADFLAAVQILVYAGTVAIIIALGIMLTRRESMENSNPDHKRRWLPAGLSALFAAVIIYILTATPWKIGNNPVVDTVSALADLMLGQYVFAFETAAVLLLVAMVGAIILAKGADEG